MALRNVYLAEDMFSTGYVGGNDTQFFKTAADYQKYTSGGDNFASIFALLAPYSSQEYPNPMDMTGKFRREREPLDETAEDGSVKYHYASAPFYDKLWNFQTDDYTADNDSRFVCGSGAMNTMIFQGHQALYNPSTGLFDLVVKNTGGVPRTRPCTSNPRQTIFRKNSEFSSDT